MKIFEYSLRVKKDLLLDVNIEFSKGKINHLLGQNGTGKSCFAKSILGRYNYKGRVEVEAENVVLIGSYSNIPSELKLKDIFTIARESYEESLVLELYKKLRLEQLGLNNKIRRLSDGQKQKIKLFFYLASAPQLIILDEFTNALDKETCREVYTFLTDYVRENRDCTIVNITHNLSDLEHLEGEYYLINNKKIEKIKNKEEIVKLYIEGV